MSERAAVSFGKRLPRATDGRCSWGPGRAMRSRLRHLRIHLHLVSLGFMDLKDLLAARRKVRMPRVVLCDHHARMLRSERSNNH